METGRNVAPFIIDICGQKFFVKKSLMDAAAAASAAAEKQFASICCHFGRLAHFYRFGRNIRLMQVNREKIKKKRTFHSTFKFGARLSGIRMARFVFLLCIKWLTRGYA